MAGLSMLIEILLAALGSRRSFIRLIVLWFFKSRNFINVNEFLWNLVLAIILGSQFDQLAGSSEYALAAAFQFLGGRLIRIQSILDIKYDM